MTAATTLAPGRLDALLATRTPTVAWEDASSGCTLWLKQEYQLPSGSTKDRLASHVLAKAVAAGRVDTGTVVVEASSGSTSIAFAMACAALGVRFLAVLPEGVSNERLLIIRRYGGEWALVPAEGGMAGAVAETERMAAADPAVFLPRQFTNPDNAEAHELRTGPELVEAVTAAGARLDGFVASVGTAGTLMGVGRVVRAAAPGAVVARVLVADEALDAEQGGPACLGIPGVVDCMSGLLDEAELGGHPPLAVPRGAAMDATRELARRGFPVGPSSGLNLAGARLLARELGPGHHVATVLSDRMERYFSTDLFDDLR
ncbi:MAG TPA: cysteine synthase family protein [Acidimicrobiales bacterium]|nr:cysteine synthase family protein [Acidimicrobiales bacterium]